jgi:chromosome segregation ATPase
VPAESSGETAPATLSPSKTTSASELQSLRERVRSLSSEIASLESTKRELSETVESSVQQIKQLQAESLAKDKRLAKVRTSEQQVADEVAQLRSASSNAQAQLDALRRDLLASETRVRELTASLSSAEQQSSESVQQTNERVAAARRRAEDAEAALERQTAAARAAAIAAERRLDEAVAASAAMSDSVAALQHAVDAQTARCNDLQQQLASAQGELEATQNEFAQYRLEAHQVLASVASDQKPSAGQSSDSAASEAVVAELAAGRTYIAELERQLREARAAAVEATQAAARDVAAAEATAREAEGAVVTLRRELLSSREQLAHESGVANERALALQNEIDNLVQRARAADKQVESLREQMSTLMVSSSSDAGAAERQELENRLRTMTEHLIAKQTQLETLTSERSYLQLKVEQEQQQRQLLEKQQRSARLAASTTAARVRPISSLLKRRNSDDPFGADEDDFDDAPDSVVINIDGNSPAVPQGTPSKRPRSFVVKNAVSVANALDAVSSIAGRFLSLSPLARLLVIVYVVLLHSWVAYIVLSYSPEVHGRNGAPTLSEHVSNELNLSHNRDAGLPH